MDQSRGSYLLCFPDFPCKSFKLKDFRPPAPYLVDSKRSRRRGVLFMFYDVHIPRCAHIKTNGTQCGSPALREQRLCFFHEKWQRQQITLKTEPPPNPPTRLMNKPASPCRFSKTPTPSRSPSCRSSASWSPASSIPRFPVSSSTPSRPPPSTSATCNSRLIAPRPSSSIPTPSTTPASAPTPGTPGNLGDKYRRGRRKDEESGVKTTGKDGGGKLGMK